MAGLHDKIAAQTVQASHATYKSGRALVLAPLLAATLLGIGIPVTEVASVAEASSASAEQVSASTQQTSASTQEIASSAQALAGTAERLTALVGRFKTTA